MRIRALSRCSATIPRPFAIESTEIGEINTLLPGSQLPVSTTTYRITHRSSSNSMSSIRPINPSVASIPNPRSSPMLNSIVTSLLGSDRDRTAPRDRPPRSQTQLLPPRLSISTVSTTRASTVMVPASMGVVAAVASAELLPRSIVATVGRTRLISSQLPRSRARRSSKCGFAASARPSWRGTSSPPIPHDFLSPSVTTEPTKISSGRCPQSSITVAVGQPLVGARYRIHDHQAVRRILRSLFPLAPSAPSLRGVASESSLSTI